MPTTQEQQFDREVENLLTVKHENIIRFLGYCSNRHKIYISTTSEERKLIQAYELETILCFQFASNGNLRKHINGTTINHQMQFLIRFAILFLRVSYLHCLLIEVNLQDLNGIQRII